MVVAELKNIGKIYGKGEASTEALRGIELKIEKGDFWAIIGPSGSGKSTLLNILGCIDVPTSGEYFLNGQLVNKFTNSQLSAARNETISFIFQYFALLNEYTVYENIMLPLNCRKISVREKKQLVNYYMKRLGIEGLSKKKPTQISGGQQQRVAIARALVTKPDIILADEPTGALDRKTGEEVMKILHEINAEGKTIVVVTHDMEVAKAAKKQFYIEDGILFIQVCAKYKSYYDTTQVISYGYAK